jgi:radical SAM protein with 4Fe4S-binding SPASM domain
VEKGDQKVMNPIQINPRVGWRTIEDEVVAFNCETQEIAVWNEAASELWRLLYTGVALESLVNWLASAYSLVKQQALEDTMTFLNEANAFMGLSADESVLGSTSSLDDGVKVLLDIELKAIEYLIPFAITFETTYACNEKCIHCYMDKRLPSLRLDEIKRILNEIAQEGCLFISFTGGEFFARKDALKIIEYASELDFVIDILSNGTLIDERKAQSLAQYSVRRVQISIYGARPEIHDAITLLPGSFEKSLRAIEFLKGAGIKVEIAFPLMSRNFEERYAVKTMAESLDCALSPSHIISARNDGSRDTYQLRMNDQQLQEFLADKELSSLYAGRKPFKEHLFYFGLSDIRDAAPCYSGFNSCAITPAGKVLPCNQLLYDVGDLKKQSFSKIWHESTQLDYLRNVTIHDLTICARCQSLSSCTRCPGLALLEGDDLLGPSPMNCKISKVVTEIHEKGGDRDEKG